MYMVLLCIGIGLTSVRGSGTSGYVQTNKFQVRGSGRDRKGGRGDGGEASDSKKKQTANQDIINHNKKREIEVKVMEYRIQLEDEEVADEEIEVKVEEYRRELQRTLDEDRDRADGSNSIVQKDTHEVAALKQKKMEQIRDAFGFDKDIVEGEAFDQELQQRRKEERIAERKRKEEERIREEIRIEKRRRKMHKRGYYGENEEGPERWAPSDGEYVSSDSLQSGELPSEREHPVDGDDAVSPRDRNRSVSSGSEESKEEGEE